ncbi:MAG: SRPBCC family protein [Actinomycetota bacterium]
MPVQADEVVREVRIEAAPTDVFPYFTDPKKLIAWKAASAEIDARPGGRFRMDVTGRGDVAEGEYLDIDPPHRIRFTWQWEAERSHTQVAASAPSVVEVTLTPDGDGTLLRLVHRGISGPNRDGSAVGWTHYLARLVLVASGHEPVPDPWAEPPTDPSR